MQNRYYADQKTRVSTLFAFLSGRLSKIHSSFPSSLILLHHLKPTNILPVTFFTVQKSKAAKVMTRIYLSVLSEDMSPKNKYILNPNSLNRRWKTHAVGLA